MAFAPAARATEPHAVLETTVGMEGVYQLRSAGPMLQAAPVDEAAPVVLRIANAVRDGNATIYELRYIGTVPGVHDLGNYLRGQDGLIPKGLDRIPVAVRAVLPNDHDGHLDEIDRPRSGRPWPYRLMFCTAALLWMARPAWLLARRMTRRRTKEPVAEAGEPTLADQLRPLVEGAVTDGLCRSDRARLERLLVAHWRLRLHLEGCSMPEALARMQQDIEAGRLLRGLEHWLYEPPSRHAVNVEELLAPYRGSPPMRPRGQVSPAGGEGSERK
jgi:hypothetical protein